MLGEWAAFEEHYGPLLVHERVDIGLARLAAIMAGESDVTKFLPPWLLPVESEEDEEAAAFALFERLKASARR